MMAFLVTISLFVVCLICSTVTAGTEHENVLVELLSDSETQTKYSVTKSVRAQQSSPTEEALKHRLEMSTEYFYIPERSSNRQQQPSTPSNILLITAPTANLSLIPTSASIELLRKEQWTLPILIISICSMLLMFAFEIFVLCKASRTTPSRRHLFLGQMLLLGLFLCSALAALITLQPTPITCATIRFGIGVSYALVFAALLVKCVFLISLNSGVYLPAPYQGLLLLFAVLIQITIGIQWLINTPPIIQVLNLTKQPSYYQTSQPSTIRHRFLVTAARDVTSERTTITNTHEDQLITLCQTPYMDILISLIYVIFLIIFVAILAIKSRGIRDNYRESTYIGLAVGFTIPIWLMWSLSGLIIIERYRDASLACGLLGTSLVIFLVMFLPKGRQLAAMGKEGVYVEDREDRFSSLSRAGSGYSPSFFHFKPMKYSSGGLGGATTITGNNNNITTMTNNSHKRHPTTVTTLGGDHLALYPSAAAASNYTRMYHCYPCANGIPAALCTSTTAPLHYTTPGSIFLRSDDGNVYTTLEPTLSSNPNVYFQRNSLVHPGMMY
ncbi:uncharacterized protein LOC123293126 [Chrysoperla carnea]|uniref:uncharacterized protein LOC123293126 n=1 Tax=Chrysoperla carnea TaxID=189513 RepID=UPI001D0932AE|nr:uncharacterized protein LOC123293126 [Chrysoperla carnea]